MGGYGLGFSGLGWKDLGVCIYMYIYIGLGFKSRVLQWFRLEVDVFWELDCWFEL